ncbi:MAG: hypothetical protein ACREC9_12390 [Methylocella sp.]
MSIARARLIEAIKRALKSADNALRDDVAEFMANCALDAIHPLAAIVPRFATDAMSIAGNCCSEADVGFLNEAIAAGDLTREP